MESSHFKPPMVDNPIQSCKLSETELERTYDANYLENSDT
jgi:hypothetical protein